MSLTSDSDRHYLRRIFNRAYFAQQCEGSAKSAAIIVPLLHGLFPNIRSVIDVGCGTGAWLHEFQLRGIPKILGLDGGDPTEGLLQIEAPEFRSVDLSLPLAITGKYDLALSLEVAQHLPTNCAEDFVVELTKLSDIVVFGAAIPGQVGEHHFHERWPSYWAGLFEANGYICFELLRNAIWYDSRIEACYVQNMLIYIRKNRTDITADLQSKAHLYPQALDVVHPRTFESVRITAEHALGIIGASAREVQLIAASLSTVARAAEISTTFEIRLIEEGYKGFNILQIEPDRFLALGQSEGAYSPDKLADGTYKLAYVGTSIDGVKEQILSGRLATSIDGTKEQILGATHITPFRTLLQRAMKLAAIFGKTS